MTGTSSRRWVPTLALAVVVVLTGCGGGGTPVVDRPGAAPAPLTAQDAEIAEVVEPSPVDAREGERERPVPIGATAPLKLDPSPPVGVEIPAIGVRSELERLTLDGVGAITPPVDFDLAGWYAEGTQPGQIGPAVLAGHVDSTEGPAVFHRLSELRPGDDVLVRRQDGSTVTFEVDDVEQHPKDAFPTDAVYGPVLGPELRLVTCGGTFDDSTGHYRDNIVVYASPA